jgi:hypothetical protein
VFAGFDVKGLGDQPLEGRRMTGGGPQLELRVAGRSYLQQGIVSTIVKIEPGNQL